MLKVDGNNVFENNEYSWSSWSADVLQTPEEIRAAFDAIDVVGRKVVHIRAIGLGYNLTEDSIEDLVYRHAEKLTPEQRGGVKPEDWYDDAMLCPRSVEIDEPVIITLDNGDRLEIIFSDYNWVRMSKNCLPPDIKFGTNSNNFDAAKLFSCCIGQTITGLEIQVAPMTPDILYLCDMDSTSNSEYIDVMNIVFDNATKLQFSNWFDYGWVRAVDGNDETLKIRLDELKALTTPRYDLSGMEEWLDE